MPPRAQAKLEALQQQAADSDALLRASHEATSALRQQLGHAINHRCSIGDDDVRAVQKAEAAIEEIDARIKQQEGENLRRQDRLHAAQHLVARINEWRARLRPNVTLADVEVEIPDAEHHVMIDQPLALVAALRTLLATWPS